MLFLTPRFIATGLPSSYSTPDAPPSPAMPDIFRRSSSSSSARVFFCVLSPPAFCCSSDAVTTAALFAAPSSGVAASGAMAGTLLSFRASGVSVLP